MSSLLTIAAPSILAVAIALCSLPAARQRIRWQVALPSLLALASLAAGAQMAWIWNGPSRRLALTLSPWTARLFDAGPRFEVDWLAAFCGLAICLVTLLGSLRALDDGLPAEEMVTPLAVALASLIFCHAAAAPLGLVGAWLLLDLAVFSGGQIRRRGLLTGQIGLLCVLAGLVGSLEATRLGIETPASARFWLLSAAGIRMATYPLSWALPRSRASRPWQSLPSRIAPSIAGASLALRLADGNPGDGDAQLLFVLLPGLIAVVMGALLAWLSLERARHLDWAASHSAGLVLLAAGLGSSVAAMLLLVDLILGRSVQMVMPGTRSRPARLAGIVATASLAGLPPMVGFAARLLLYDALLRSGLELLLVAVMIATVLVTTPVGRKDLASAEPSRWSRWLPGALAFAAALPLLALWQGWLPPWLPPDRPPSPGQWPTVAPGLLLSILLPPLLGQVLARSGWGWRRAGADSPRRSYGQLLGLTALFDALRTGLIQGGRLLHRSLGLVEGHRTMAITLLAAVAVGLTLMVGSAPAAQPSSLEPLGIGLWIAAIAIAGLNLFATQRWVTLSVLLASYLLGAGALLLTGSRPLPSWLLISAMIKPLAGIVVVAILAISLAQLSAESPSSATEGPRSPLLQSEPTDRSERLLRLLALAIAVLLVGGLRSVTLGEVLSDALLRPALTLVAGAVLTAIFARSTLRLSVAVLVALCGFEMIYARLDPGLIMTGGLAVFHILFAILASLSVGQPLDPEAS